MEEWGSLLVGSLISGIGSGVQQLGIRVGHIVLPHLVYQGRYTRLSLQGHLMPARSISIEPSLHPLAGLFVREDSVLLGRSLASGNALKYLNSCQLIVIAFNVNEIRCWPAVLCD